MLWGWPYTHAHMSSTKWTQGVRKKEHMKTRV